MHVIPCALCGYDAPQPVCKHCGGSSADPSFGAPRSRAAALRDGLSALPRGLAYLSTTRGTKRWLVPPFVLTTLAFAALFVWAWNGFEDLVAYAQGAAQRAPVVDPSWWQRAFETVLESSVFLLIAKLTGVLLFLVIGFFAALYAFSLFYEAISGPFLDEVQGRIERRWFGVDPRNALERPTALSVGICVRFTAAAAALAAALGLAAWFYAGEWRWWALSVGVLLPFLGLSLWKRQYGLWLWWALRSETSTLWTSVRTSLVALALLIVCLPLKFVPLFGPLLFAGVAGFATAISLLDIPFSRRRWSLGQRLAFLGHNLPALIGFGSVASLVFLIPFAGPILMVPGASIGGLWLLVRLDKSKLRENSARHAARLGNTRTDSAQNRGTPR